MIAYTVLLSYRRSIQCGTEGHSSVEDSEATMDLVLLKLERGKLAVHTGTLLHFLIIFQSDFSLPIIMTLPYTSLMQLYIVNIVG